VLSVDLLVKSAIENLGCISDLNVCVKIENLGDCFVVVIGAIPK
jgi:hypothetical protein